MLDNRTKARREAIRAAGGNVGRLPLPGAEPCACTVCGGIGCDCASHVYEFTSGQR